MSELGLKEVEFIVIREQTWNFQLSQPNSIKSDPVVAIKVSKAKKSLSGGNGTLFCIDYEQPQFFFFLQVH